MSRPQTRLVDELFALDSRIRYVALLDRNSKLLESRMRSNVMSLTPETYDRKFMASVPPMILDTLSQLENQCGPLTHISIQYKKVDLVIFPHNNQIVAISLEPGPLEPILRKLRDSLNIHIHLGETRNQPVVQTAAYPKHGASTRRKKPACKTSPSAQTQRQRPNTPKRRLRGNHL